MMNFLNATQSRRTLLQSLTIAGVTMSVTGWLKAFSASPRQKPAKSIIVLWLNGGPATIDLWDLKTGHENGGLFHEIQTNVPGINISENFPQLAQQGDKLAIIRSMKTREGDHNRASFLLRTGYTPQGAILFPTLGSLVTKELGETTTSLPGYISIAPPPSVRTIGNGFLGPQTAPLILGEDAAVHNLPVTQALGVPNLKALTTHNGTSHFDLLNEMNTRFQKRHPSAVGDSIENSIASAHRLMEPGAASVFDLSMEDLRLRERYGSSIFGQGCLLARRLVERGASFVEVTLDGWDTHQNNFERVKELSGTLDRGFSTLLTDLKQRGLLNSTLVVCQGEFGRTPKINGQAGRDHWPSSWSVVLAGGGLKTGQVIGKTASDGVLIEDRPVTVQDLIATMTTVVGIDPQKQNLSNVGRPISIAAQEAVPVEELL